MRPVKIEEIIRLMYVEIDNSKVFFNKRTGEINFLNKNDSETKNFDNYEELPLEFNDLNLMEDFSYKVNKHDISNSLLKALQGKMAFMEFKKLILMYGIEVKWQEYRENEYRKIAMKWCNENKLDYI